MIFCEVPGDAVFLGGRVKPRPYEYNIILKLGVGELLRTAAFTTTILQF